MENGVHPGPGEEDDHYFPVAKGGTDHWFNLVRSCLLCNRSKAAHCGTWFRLRMGTWAQTSTLTGSSSRA